MLGCSYTSKQSVVELFVSFWVKNYAQAAATVAYTTAGKCSFQRSQLCCRKQVHYKVIWAAGADAFLHLDLHLIKTWLGNLSLGCQAALGLGCVRSAPLSAGWVVCSSVQVFVHAGVGVFPQNQQWEFCSCEGGLSLLGCLSWGSNTPGSILLWPEQDILKNTWFSWSTIFKFQILNQFVTFVFICLENSFDTFSIYQH